MLYIIFYTLYIYIIYNILYIIYCIWYNIYYILYYIYIILYSVFILYYIVLYCILLYFIIFYYILLYFIILYFILHTCDTIVFLVSRHTYNMNNAYFVRIWFMRPGVFQTGGWSNRLWDDKPCPSWFPRVGTWSILEVLRALWNPWHISPGSEDRHCGVSSGWAGTWGIYFQDLTRGLHLKINLLKWHALAWTKMLDGAVRWCWSQLAVSNIDVPIRKESGPADSDGMISSWHLDGPWWSPSDVPVVGATGIGCIQHPFVSYPFRPLFKYPIYIYIISLLSLLASHLHAWTQDCAESIN